MHKTLSSNPPMVQAYSSTVYGTIPHDSRSNISLVTLESNSSAFSGRNYKTLLTQHLLTVPFILACSVLFAAVLEFDPSTRGLARWDMFIVGFLGWVLSFLVRHPIYFLLDGVLRIPPQYSAIVTLVLAGIVEEASRLVCIKLFIDQTSNSELFLQAYFLGLGWSLAGSVYLIVQNLLIIRPYRTSVLSDVRSVESRRQLVQIIGQELNEITPWWGVFWRFTSVMMHLGLSLCVAYENLLVWPAALIHGVLYVAWGEYLSVFGIPATSYVTLLVSMAIFLIGLAFFGEIV